MDIGPIFFKEIDFMISLKNRPDSFSGNCSRFEREKSWNGFFPLKVGPMSILRNSDS